MEIPVLRLKPREERRLLSGHAWVYSNEIDVGFRPIRDLKPGQPVVLHSARGQFLAWGYANPHSLIAVRCLSRREDQPWNRSFLQQKLASALAFRERFFEQPFYRAVYGEGDGLSGLVIDRYGDHWVVQINTAGMECFQSDIVDLLRTEYQASSVLIRADASVRQLEQLPSYVEVAHGEVPSIFFSKKTAFLFRYPCREGRKQGGFTTSATTEPNLPNTPKGLVCSMFFAMEGDLA